MTHAELVAAGFDVSPEAHRRLAAFIDALLTENRKLNLTAIRDPDAAWVLHVCDSLALLPLLRAAREQAPFATSASGPGEPDSAGEPTGMAAREPADAAEGALADAARGAPADAAPAVRADVSLREAADGPAGKPADAAEGGPASAPAQAPENGQAPALRVLDLGSGGGVPGVPLACAMPEAHFTLLDATRKKLDAAQRIAGAVGVSNVRTLWGRAEQLAHDPAERERYDVVVARAVAKLPLLVEWAAGFVRVGGYCGFSKSVEAAGPEVAAAERATRLCGLRCEGYTDYELPRGQGRRVIVVYAKVRPLRGALPRSPGEAKRKPL